MHTNLPCARPQALIHRLSLIPRRCDGNDTWMAYFAVSRFLFETLCHRAGDIIARRMHETHVCLSASQSLLGLSPPSIASHSQPTRATRHGVRKYKQGEPSLPQLISALQGVSTLLTNVRRRPLTARARHRGTRENHRVSLQKVNTKSRLQQMTRGAGLFPSKI